VSPLSNDSQKGDRNVALLGVRYFRRPMPTEIADSPAPRDPFVLQYRLLTVVHAGGAHDPTHCGGWRQCHVERQPSVCAVQGRGGAPRTRRSADNAGISLQSARQDEFQHGGGSEPGGQWPGHADLDLQGLDCRSYRFNPQGIALYDECHAPAFSALNGRCTQNCPSLLCHAMPPASHRTGDVRDEDHNTRA
jgi:hypothetical protein